MSAELTQVSVQILDKEYMIACPVEEKEALLESARLLNQRMRQVRDSGKVLGTERMAVVTALNVIHEASQEVRRQRAALEQVDAELRRLEDKVGRAAGRFERR